MSAGSEQGVPLQVGADHALLQRLLVIPQNDCVGGSAIWTIRKKKMTPSRTYIYRLIIKVNSILLCSLKIKTEKFNQEFRIGLNSFMFLTIDLDI